MHRLTSHVTDLLRPSRTWGHMIFHSMLPGFDCHKHTVDCLRFCQDWFEEVENRIILDIVDKFIGDGFIADKYCKPYKPFMVRV